MHAIHILSTQPPFDSPDIARSAVGVISTADAMGLLEGVEIHNLDIDSFREVVGKIATAGIGTDVQAELATPSERVGRSEILHMLNRLETVLEESPVPESEWRSLESLFGIDRLSALLGVSPASIRRYLAGTRSTPDALAGRLHFLATLVGDLAGAYNEIGIRRWFERPRTALNGKAPAQLMQGEWVPDDPGLQGVRELARSISGSPAT